MLIEEKLTKQELFTTTEKRIVDYIRRNIEAAVYMTIEELAKATYTSHSAIIRLCKKMGFSGFKEYYTKGAKGNHTNFHTNWFHL